MKCSFCEMKIQKLIMLKKIMTSSPADSRPRELSPYYWPLPLTLGPTSPLFPFDEIFFSQQPVRNRLLDMSLTESGLELMTTHFFFDR